MAVKESRREIIVALWHGTYKDVFMLSNCVKFCFKEEARYFKTLRFLMLVLFFLIFCYSILFGKIKSVEA